MTPQAEFGPDVSGDEEQEQPMPDDYDADRAWALSLLSPEAQALLAEPYKSAARNAQIAKGAALAESIDRYKPDYAWWVSAKIDGRINTWVEPVLPDALIALAEACDGEGGGDAA